MTGRRDQRSSLCRGAGDKPSQAMQDLIDGLRDRRKASVGQAPPTLADRRAAFAPAGRRHPVSDDVAVREVTAGGVRAHWLAAPVTDAGRVLLFLHGGGFELASVRSDGELAARLGRGQRDPGAVPWEPPGPRASLPRRHRRRLGPMALAPHRPGPERKFNRGGRRLGRRRTSRLSARGDARRGGGLPAAAVLMSPTMDLTGSGASMTDRGDQDPISTPAMLCQFASGHLAGADPRTPLASPLLASLSGLPPLVQAGAADLLLSDSERLARAAAETGVDVSLESAGACPTSTRSCSAPGGRQGH
jgi:monoterpene epsilon-lactone hydrolase